MRKLIIIVIAILLVLPTATVLYILAGGGWLGSILCLLLGVVAHFSVSVVVGLVIEAYEWFKYRRDWTNINKDGKL